MNPEWEEHNGAFRIDEWVLSEKAERKPAGTMNIFTSTHVVKVDAKGRACVPAPFRTALSSDPFAGFVGIRSHYLPAIEGYPSARMEMISRQFDLGHQIFSEDYDDLATAIFGGAISMPMDETGRIVIPRELLAFANIKDKAAFMGMGPKFQIWNADDLESRLIQARDIAKKKSLMVPWSRS